MIKENELRIGNWLAYSKTCPVRPEFIGNFRAISENDFKFIKSGFYDPIPITPEILIACGFYQIVRFGETYTKGTKLAIQKDSCYWWTNAWGITDDNEFEPLAAWTPIYFLHQLQNLYFALTGEELKITFKELTPH